MRNLVLIITLILLWGCATQTTTYKPQTQKVKEITPTEIYKNHPVNISLIQNKNLFEQLENKIITKSVYDSLLTDLGRFGEKYYQLDQLICNTESDSIYNEIIRAEYFLHNDSLLHIVDQQLLKLVETDSINASLYVLLSISKYKQKDISNSIYYLQQAKKYTSPFDNSWLYMAVAVLYEDNNQPFNAIKEYEKGFKINNSLMLDEWDNLFDLYITTGQYSKAEKLFNEVELVSSETDFRNNHWDKLVDLLWKKDELSEAESICLAVRDTSNFTSTTKELVLISIKKGDFKSAEDYLWELSSVEIQSVPFQSKFNFADFYFWEEHYSETFSQLKNDISQLSQNQSANFCFGYFLVAKEMNQWNDKDRDASKIREGLAYLKNTVTDNSKVNFIVGYLLQSLDENEEAISYYKQVPNNTEFYPHSQINLSVLTQLVDINQSLSYLLKAEKSLPNNVRLLKKISLYYYSLIPDYKTAIDWLTRVLSIDQNDHLYSIWLANSYLQIDDIENAQLTISQTIDRIFTDSGSWIKNWYLGMAYKTKGDINQKFEKWDQAKRDYENSIKYNPRDMEPRLALASVYYQLEDLKSAETTYITVIDSLTSTENIDYSNYYKVLNSLNIHYLIFDPDPYRHAELFEKAIIYFPSDDWCYRMLGIAYKNQNNYYKAEKYLNKAIEINPDNWYNYSYLAEAYEEEGIIDKSIENYHKAIRVIEKENSLIDKENEFDDYQSNLKSIGEYHSKIAKLYEVKEDYDQAILEYQKAISITPDTTRILYKFDLASAYFKNKDFEKAIENWELVYKKEEDLNAYFNIGLSYLNIGDSENLKKSKRIFTDFIEKIQDKPNFIEIKSEAQNFIEIINAEIERVEWPVKIEELASSDQGVVSEIAKLYQLTDQYREINNLWLEGVKETTPNKEYLEYSKKWIITSYDVSPKIFQSENLCDRFKAKLSSLTITNSRLKEVQSLWISSVVSRKEGISEHSKGYYIKAKDYAGEYERGIAKIDVADEYYADGLKILKTIMEENIESFSSFGVESLQDKIDYYSGEEK